MNEQDKITTNEKLGRVYLITSPSGRKYVGSTERDVEERWNEYKCESSTREQVRIHRSIKKYGWDAHTKEVIWEGPFELMLRMEHVLGIEHNVLDNKLGLNCMLPGYDDVPGLVSEETRKKMSDSGKGRIFSEEHRRKIGEANSRRIRVKKEKVVKEKVNKARTVSEETKKKISASSKGKKLSDEHKNKISQSNKGKVKPPVSEETRLKMSIKRKGTKHTQESINKMKNRVVTEETRRKMGEANKNRPPISEEQRKRMSDIGKLQEHTPTVLISCLETGQVFLGLKSAAEFFETTVTSIWNNLNGVTEKLKRKYKLIYLNKEQKL